MDTNFRAEAIDLRRRVEAELREDILPFWMRHSPDHERGGFHGAITNDLRVEPDAPKGIILNARILWTFSRACEIHPEPRLRELARRAFDYIVRCFLDGEFGGVYWTVDSRGRPLETAKRTYGQAFAIYALAQYYYAAKDSAALDLALELMKVVLRRCGDPAAGGFFETFDRDWSLSRDQRLSMVDLDEKKSMNTHLHLLEACAALVRVSPQCDARKTLDELTRIFLDHIIDPGTSHFRMFFNETWECRSDRISFGHDIEGSWLLCEAAGLLGDRDMQRRVRSVAVRMARAVLAEAVDRDGGLSYEADPSGIIDHDRHWWPQAEAVVGFLNAFELTGKPEYLDAAGRAWQFIEDRIIDRNHGEWFWKVSRDGVPDPCRFKVDLWKGPYHNGRCCMEAMERLDRLLAGPAFE
jgi:mannobiose 2-epimerase